MPFIVLQNHKAAGHSGELVVGLNASQSLRQSMSYATSDTIWVIADRRTGSVGEAVHADAGPKPGLWTRFA